MEKLAKIISFLFFPLFMSFYGLALLFSLRIFSVYPIRYILLNFLIAFIFCLLLPTISFILLEKIGLISNFKMYKKEDRVLPLTLTSLSFLFCSYKLYLYAMPMFIVDIAISTSIAILFVAIISHWWKISGHMTGVGALVSSILSVGLSTYTNTSFAFCCFILISGLVASARYYQKKHTFSQLAAGFVNGFLSIQIFSNLQIANLFQFI